MTNLRNSLSSNDFIPRVIVAHPGRQHSHQLAIGLAEAGMLAKFVTGVPCHVNAAWPIARRWVSRYAKSYEISLDPALVQHYFISPVVRKAATRLLPRRWSASLSHRGDGWFDRLTAGSVANADCDAIICYENSALHTFRKAKAVHKLTILDAASFHHVWQDKFDAPMESARAHRRIIQHKDAELRLADHVITVSDFARESYLSVGLDPRCVHSLPLGVDATKFQVKEWFPCSGAEKIRIAYVGHICRRKGIDVLLSAIDCVRQRSVLVDVSFFGKCVGDIDMALLKDVQLRGWLPQSLLAQHLKDFDLFVLPSRHDSFGMVVPEAMACGLPVIVSEHVGAKVLVQPEKNGLVVPAENVTALANAICWFHEHRGRLPEMGAAARAAAEAYSWENYRLRAAELIKKLISQDGDR